MAKKGRQKKNREQAEHMRRLMVTEMLMRCLTRYNRDGKTYTKKRNRDRAWSAAKDTEDIQRQTCERCAWERRWTREDKQCYSEHVRSVFCGGPGIYQTCCPKRVQAASKHCPSVSKHLIFMSKPGKYACRSTAIYSMASSKLSDQLTLL